MNRWSLVVGAGILAIVAGILYVRAQNSPPSARDAARQAAVACDQVAVAFERQQSRVWLVLAARVARLLPDEQGRFLHQRFIVRCRSGQTVLITNDVSVGTRAPIHRGDEVVVRGQYIWNNQGGLVHYTHSGTPGGGGWIFDRGRVYS